LFSVSSAPTEAESDRIGVLIQRELSHVQRELARADFEIPQRVKPAGGIVEIVAVVGIDQATHFDVAVGDGPGRFFVLRKDGEREARK
jgi:hypothetical protein